MSTKIFFLLAVVAAVAVVATAHRRGDGDRDRDGDRRRNGGQVTYEQNATCNARNSGRRARPARVTPLKTCRCVEPNWQRCETRNAATTTAATSAPTTTTVAPTTTTAAPTTTTAAPTTV